MSLGVCSLIRCTTERNINNNKNRQRFLVMIPPNIYPRIYKFLYRVYNVGDIAPPLGHAP